MHKRKIILFYPKTDKHNNNMHLPLPVLVVASGLLRKGFSVDIIDERREPDYKRHLPARIKDAILFGVSAMTGYQIKGGLDASHLVKAIDKDKPIIWGGWHVSMLPEQSLQASDIDVVVVGPGEDVLSEISNRICHKIGLSDISGIAYKDNGRILKNFPRTIGRTQSISRKAIGLLDISSYIQETELGSNSIFWVSSQGCPYNCGFCCSSKIYNRKWNGLEAEEILDDIKWLVEEYNINGINFVDTNFFVNKERVLKIATGLIRNRLNIRWVASVRVDQLNLLDEKSLGLLRRSGCIKLFVGAESGSREVLKLIDKSIDIDDVFKMAGLLNKGGIIAELFVMAGFPLDPENELGRTLDLVKNIKKMYPNHQFTSFIYTPYPGTPLFDLAIKNGLKVPSSIEGWMDWNILETRTPWVKRRGYADHLHSFVKMYYPLAFPSDSLRDNFKKAGIGWLYWLLHRLVAIRVKRNCFILPIEWEIIKFVLKLKERYKVFANLSGFR